MNSELNKNEMPRFCCLYNQEISCRTCYEIGMVAEGLFPKSELPSDIDMGTNEANKCLMCEYHIE